MPALPSIYALQPLEQGGRVARLGNIYQDHVGVKILLCLLDSSVDYDVQFESEDDIVMIKKHESPVTVEFLQVKSNNLQSRWSVAQILQLELLQKSLQRGRCEEEVAYKIISSYDVNDELVILKQPLAQRTDLTETDKLITLILSKNVAIPKNAKGQGVAEWVKNCTWDKWADSVEALRNSNLVYLETLLSTQRSLTLPLDQKEELYQKLLTLVQNASSLTRQTFDKQSLNDWLDQQLFEFNKPKGGTDLLIAKLNQIPLDTTLLEMAKEFKWQYSKESLNNQFIGRNVITKFKEEAQVVLQNLKLRFDGGELDMDSFQFHNHCLNEIDKLAKKHNIQENIARGCMYDITNRCMHRYMKPTA